MDWLLCKFILVPARIRGSPIGGHIAEGAPFFPEYARNPTAGRRFSQPGRGEGVGAEHFGPHLTDTDKV